jgi:hypothetical protein
MARALAVTAGVVAVVAVAMAFGWLHTAWFPYRPEGARTVLMGFAAAAAVVALLFLAGQLLRIRSHAYYIIIAGAAFLALDAAVWWRFGIMPGPKSYQDGFVPAAIMGLFLGPLYRVIAPAPR